MATNDGKTVMIPTYDESALCGPAFRVLKSMVATWLKEVSNFKNRYADFLLIHFYRYIAITS
jgi:DNA polymerase epsilon subunit 1